MLDVGRLATLRAVVAHGSFSAAGQALGLTQPAVSRQVTLLERQAGAQLLHRTRQGVRPTEAGRLLVEHAEAILDRLALASEQLAELSGLRRGRVRLGSFFTAFAQLTPQVCALAEARLPELAVEHELVDRRTASGNRTGEGVPGVRAGGFGNLDDDPARTDGHHRTRSAPGAHRPRSKRMAFRRTGSLSFLVVVGAVFQARAET